MIIRNIGLYLFLYVFTASMVADELKVVSFNVQNMFDAIDNGTEYKEYKPPKWGADQYQRRLTSVGKALQTIAQSLDILGLQEVENAEVVKDLQKYYLPRLQYLAVSTEKQSSVQVALLSKFKILKVNQHRIQSSKFFGLRSILEVILEVSKKEQKTIQVFVVHLKSKRKSASALVSSDEIRLLQYKLIVENINTQIPTLLLGDFNDEYALETMQKQQRAYLHDSTIVDIHSYYDEGTQRGTYYYNEWIQLDHILFDTLFQENFSDIALAIIFDEPFITMKTSKPTPNKFIPQMKNYDAVSDHLPVVLHAYY